MELQSTAETSPSCSIEQPKTFKLLVNSPTMVTQASTNVSQIQPVYRVKIPNDYQVQTTDSMEYRVLPVKLENGGQNFSSDIIPTDGTKLAIITNDGSRTSSSMVVPGGQMFVLSDAPNLASTTISPGPRNTSGVSPKLVTTREEKRRVTHNEVERRRRDKINQWIQKLGKILPMESEFENKSSQQSKGAILSSACDHITELREDNEKLSKGCDLLQKEVAQLRIENAVLKQKLNDHGIHDS